MSEWKDISSAPKEGTIVLVWDGKTMSLARWRYDDAYSNERPVFVGVIAGEVIELPTEWAEKPFYLEATHWMPLPEPPP